MANTNDSFIDEVAEAVRRDRINLWFRRWGWLIAVAVLTIVGTAALLEWRESQAEATAEFRGEAILTSLEIEEPEERLAALSELPVTGEEGVVAAFLLAAEQQQAGDPAAAVRTLEVVAQDAEVPPLYRDLAALKALMAQDEEADPAALEAMAAPGQPFWLLALEQLALLHLASDRPDEAVAALQTIREQAGGSETQRGRVEALLTALGHPPEPEAAAESEVPAPAGD